MDEPLVALDLSTLEESQVVNSGSTKVWVMDPSLFDGKWYEF
jgi:hypothetical protein